MTAPHDYIPDFVDDHAHLFDALVPMVVGDDRMRSRSTTSFGVPYNYTRMVYRQVPFPALLEGLRSRVGRQLGFAPTNCLVNYYADGRSRMGFHADSMAELAPGTGVAILSLGAPRTMEFRRIDDRAIRWELELAAGSCLYLPPENLSRWLHGIPRVAEADPRISATFRQVVPQPAC